jgi:hypothetical protein
MKISILLLFLFTIFIGTGLAMNVDIGDVEAFKQALEKDGFTVQEGTMGFLDLIKLYDTGVLPSAWGNNPSTKYLTYFVPPAPGQKVPEQFARIAAALGQSANVSAFWNIRPDEAIVFVGRTPPECRYFSYDHYLLSRTYGNETRWIFANIADTVNNLVINTTGTPNGAVGDPFNQTTVIVATADRGIDQRIRAAAMSVGYSGDIFNTQVLPSSMLNMGVENNSDTYLMVIRPALYEDKQAGEDYRNHTPAALFRITPNQTTKLDPYNYPEIRVRGTGKTEFDLMDDLVELRNAILSKYSRLNSTELPTSRTVTEGSDGIQRGIDVIGPDNDACYLWAANQTASVPTPPFPDFSKYYPFLQHPRITLGNYTNEFIIVYGVNHVATGKATYSNFAIYGADGWNGVGAIHDSYLNGTAEKYLPDNPNAKYLYVYKLARNCSGDPDCFEIPTGPGGYGIGLDQQLWIGWRIYLENATKTGPSYTEIVYDKAIKFDPKE